MDFIILILEFVFFIMGVSLICHSMFMAPLWAAKYIEENLMISVEEEFDFFPKYNQKLSKEQEQEIEF
jgi:hypothetical protein